MKDNFHDIYLQVLQDHQDYQYHNNPRNAVQYERIMTTFQLSNPVERVIYSKERKTNIIFDNAEFLWYMAGNNSLDFIGYYANRMNDYSMDHSTLTGTAYGTKLFQKMANGKSQIENVLSLLKESPDTKRAVIQIFNGNELTIPNNPDVSCTMDLQFLLRDNRLSCVAYMRSNDVFIGLTSDVFSFTMIQEYLARLLGVDVGIYYHVVGSSQIFEKDFEKSQRILEKRIPFSEYGLHYPKMPSEKPKESLETVLVVEEKLRKGILQLNEPAIEAIGLDNYWLDLVRLLELQREIHNNEKLNEKIISSMNKTIQYLFHLKHKEEQ
jgi:thymidylate synthase